MWSFRGLLVVTYRNFCGFLIIPHNYPADPHGPGICDPGQFIPQFSDFIPDTCQICPGVGPIPYRIGLIQQDLLFSLQIEVQPVLQLLLD